MRIFILFAVLVVLGFGAEGKFAREDGAECYANNDSIQCYHANGNIKDECLLSNNENYICATVASYYSDGNIESEMHTNDSTWELKEYYPNGKLKVDRIDTKQNNSINSTRKEYYPNGKLAQFATRKHITSKNVWDNLDEKDEVMRI